MLRETGGGPVRNGMVGCENYFLVFSSNRGVARGRGKVRQSFCRTIRKTILYQESFPILYFLSHSSTSMFICYFPLLHLHLPFHLLLLQCAWYRRRGADGSTKRLSHQKVSIFYSLQL
jgi:hypothetical protein